MAEGGSANSAAKTIALIGNPNCGKTTLFNVLTGSKQKVGNWPGVTVERKSGSFSFAQQTITVVDLPGIYSLTNANPDIALDEKIAIDYILTQQPDIFINIIDATNLERHLYLSLQLRELNIPLIIVLNMMDVVASQGLTINCEKLSGILKCPVIPIAANNGLGIAGLKQTIVSYQQKKCSTFKLNYPSIVEEALLQLSMPRVQALHVLETHSKETDILIADTRYQFIQTTLATCLTQTKREKTYTTYIDAIVLNRLLALPIFLSMMYLLFVFAINIGGAFQDFFDIASQTIFVDGFAYLLAQLHFPTWLIAILANGIGKGINTTLTFIPVLAAMFFFLAFLEDSGYMARAAFVVDRLMQRLGLPGKAFVPMIVGFGCNVPAIMGARTLENQRDRILTIMMAPFMSCSARLAIFAVFTAAFFPQHGQNIVFALYLIGIGMAILTGFLLRKTIFKGKASPLVMELPAYHVPQMKTLLLHAWHRLRGFIVRAGRLIIPICVLIGALNTLNIDGSLNTGDGNTQSLLSFIGQCLTPLFSPMGVRADNWPATVGLVTGVLAKEVVIGTLNTLYAQMHHVISANNDFQFWAGLQAAWQSIFANFAQLKSALVNPILAKAPMDAANENIYGIMYQYFDGKRGAFAYLLFVLLYFPCISTMAVMLRELSKGWAIFSACWMTGVAYGVAVIFYQLSTYAQHPLTSFMWVAGISLLFLLTLFTISRYAPTAVTHLGKPNPCQNKIGCGSKCFQCPNALTMEWHNAHHGK